MVLASAVSLAPTAHPPSRLKGPVESARWYHRRVTSLPPLDPAETRRYGRHLVLPEIGPEGQRRIEGARAAVGGEGLAHEIAGLAQELHDLGSRLRGRQAGELVVGLLEGRYSALTWENTTERDRPTYRFVVPRTDSVAALKEWNRLRSNNIRPGQRLTIYSNPRAARR